MQTSYRAGDVVLLLKDITGLVAPLPTPERERLIQSGRHYCEMLPIEYVPSKAYMQAYEEALDRYAQPTADAVGVLAEQIMREKGPDVVLVSLARAGIPVGILLKRYLRWRYGITVPHYSISIIRGRGIDQNAMRYLLACFDPKRLLFVDGWIGKGAILKELKKEIASYAGVSADIAVLADPAHITGLCGTKEDILIPSSCLNSTVSGLISRTFLRDDIIGPADFHGAVYYGEWKEADLSYAFIEAIESRFRKDIRQKEIGQEDAEQTGIGQKHAAGEDNVQKDIGQAGAGQKDVRNKQQNSGTENKSRFKNGMEEVMHIAEAFAVTDINFIKPGIGETTRVLLRRVPWKVLINRSDSRELQHILRLAQEKGVPVAYYPLTYYKCCGIIKKIADA